MGAAEATLARPPVVSQTEWDEALTAMTERERTVAAAMYELAAAELFDGRSQLILSTGRG